MNIKNFIILLLCTLCLASCTGEQCIDADDFGFQTFTISARYPQSVLESQKKGNEVAPWINSGYKVNGQTLTIMVRSWINGVDPNKPAWLSAWCPWYGMAGHEKVLSEFCSRLRECEFADNNMCPNQNLLLNAPIINPPCLLTNGIGLYTLIAEHNSNPNASFASARNPKGITFHLGEPLRDYDLFDIGSDGGIRKAGGMVYQYRGTDANAYAGSPLYFKILDKFYGDNSGQYKVVIKSGVSNTRPDPIEFITLLVKQNLFGGRGQDVLNNDSYSQIVSETSDQNSSANAYGRTNNSANGIIPNIFMNIVSSPGYKLAVYGMLCLYVMFTGLSYLIGNIEVTNKELVSRIVKFSIVSALIGSQNVWKVFHDNLFIYFVEGSAELLNMVQNAGAIGPGSSSLLGLMIATQTQAKLWSILFTKWSGFIYIILFLIVLIMILAMTFEAAVLYLTSLIAIGIIIVLGPIFVSFLLFESTRSLFENWLKQLISYAIQPLILFTSLAILSIIIRTEIYSSLGFRVCKHDFPNLGPIKSIIGDIEDKVDFSLTNSIFYWWFPSPMSSGDFTKRQAVIPVPNAFYPDGSDILCQPYSCFEKRYIELPFLDPTNSQDIDRINDFFSGNFVQFYGLLMIFVSVYLLGKFNATSVAIAKFITNTSYSWSDASQSAGTASSQVSNALTSKLGELASRGWESLSSGTSKRQDTTDKLKEEDNEQAISESDSKLEDESIRNSINSLRDTDALKSLEKDSNLDIRDSKIQNLKTAEKEYEETISKALKFLDPNKEHQDKSSMLAKIDFEELKDAFAQIKFGENVKYKELDISKRIDIDKAFNLSFEGKNIQTLATNLKEAKQNLKSDNKPTDLRSLDQINQEKDKDFKNTELKGKEQETELTEKLNPSPQINKEEVRDKSRDFENKLNQNSETQTKEKAPDPKNAERPSNKSDEIFRSSERDKEV
jgi:type IV secretion system protein VirB6